MDDANCRLDTSGETRYRERRDCNVRLARDILFIIEGIGLVARVIIELLEGGEDNGRGGGAGTASAARGVMVRGDAAAATGGSVGGGGMEGGGGTEGGRGREDGGGGGAPGSEKRWARGVITDEDEFSII